jgi:hypothetical protein
MITSSSRKHAGPGPASDQPPVPEPTFACAYYSAQHGEHAQKIYSDEGQHNGLHWKSADGEAQSPLTGLRT